MCLIAPALAEAGLAPEESNGNRVDKPYMASSGSVSEESGITVGKPVDNGFVFFDGKYLEPPYMVSRKGLDIFVNDKIIETEATRHADSAKQVIVQRLNLVVRQYQERLAKDHCYFFFSEGGEISLEPYIAAYELPRIVRMLRSDVRAQEKLQELQRINWHLGMEAESLKTLVSTFFAPQQFDKRLQELGESLLRVEDFGLTLGKPINKGFVFLDGEYLEAPYIVTRKGLAILINRKMIEPPMRLPLEEPPSGDVDPEIPAQISSETSLYDDIFTNYIRKKVAYVQKHYTQEEERKIMEQVYRSLPFVKAAEPDERYPDILHVVTFRGEVDSLGLVQPRRKPKFDKQTVMKRIEKRRRKYEARLEKGGCHFFFSEGGRISLGRQSVIKKLPKIVTILRSAKPDDVKFKEIRQTGLSAINSRTFSSLVTNFSASEQLQKRLDERIGRRRLGPRNVR